MGQEGMPLSTVINIMFIKVNSVASNGSVNIGESFINSPTSNLKSTGTNSSYGDHAPPSSLMKNVYIDPDVNDQNEVGNVDSAFAEQM
jgi:hypothetical protein